VKKSKETTPGADFSKLVPLGEISGFDKKETQQLRKMATDAKAFLLSFKWCKSVQECWFGWGIGKVCAVLLFRIKPAAKNVDDWLWVIVGDLPPAYLVLDGIPNPREALETYIELMQEWVDVVRRGGPVEDCIPVNAPATRDNAKALANRLDFMRRNFLDAIEERKEKRREKGLKAKGD